MHGADKAKRHIWPDLQCFTDDLQSSLAAFAATRAVSPHFDDKAELAKALLLRCLEHDRQVLDDLINREVRDLNAEGILRWRRRFRERLDLIAKRYPPREGVDLDALADMAATLIEGALVLSRALRDPKIPAQQVMLYRDFVRCVFAAR